jgi:hypothetical protein
MRKTRYLWFGLSILLGTAAGLVLGWLLRPMSYASLNPSSLRTDYQTDYVLMVAEVFQSDGNLSQAFYSLGQLSEEAPLRQVQQAILKAREIGYISSDLDLLISLSQAMLAAAPIPTGTVP